jgi:triacylglycerol lipase
MTHIYLLPGFMGFQSFGEIAYFRRVPKMLVELLGELGHDRIEVHECPTIPTGSIARRAQQALEFIAGHGGEQAESIHIIGHSTGGLDARLLATPGARLVTGRLEERIGRRIHSIVTMSTPHYGSPIAYLLRSLPFRKTFEMLGLLGVKPHGRRGFLALARVIELVARSDDWTGRTDTFLDTIVNKVLKRVGKDADDLTFKFLRDLSNDQGASIQLTMEAMHLFNAAVADRPGTQYSSIICVAPPPSSFPFRPADFLSPVRAVSIFAFWALYRITSAVPRQYPCTALDIETLNLNEHSAPIEITKASNDGVVPCQSQAYGKVLDIVLGDHLDVVGHFPYSGGDRHADWLPCGAGFDEDQFRRVWSLVAREIAGNIPVKRRAARTLEAPARASKAPTSKNGKSKSKLVSSAN